MLLCLYTFVFVSTEKWCMDFQAYHRSVINGKEDDFLLVSDSIRILSLCNPKTGDSLLHVACRYGKLNILRILVETHGADVEIGNFEGKRLLHEAAQYSQWDCINYLLHNHLCSVQVNPLKRADWTPLMLAATKSSVDVINLLLDAGADPLLRNKDGWNSFHIACREGHLPILDTLMKNSPSGWDTKSNNQRTPLHTAALHGKTDVISWLLQHSSYDIDLRDSCGVSPLMDALRAGYVDVATILVKDYKADPGLQDKIGRHAIHQVCQAGQLEALDFLVTSTQASVNVASNLTGETPLHTASKEGQDKIIERLIHYGAEINQTDHKGRTALHIASGSQYMACVQVLLQHNPMILKDNNGSLPADLARKAEIKELFKESLL